MSVVLLWLYQAGILCVGNQSVWSGGMCELKVFDICGEDVDMSTPLTPSHFLIGRGSAFQEVPREGSHNIIADDLVLREPMRTEGFDTFWVVWRGDYIRHLPPYKGHVGPGSVMLIRDDECPSMCWALGLITKVCPVTDGIVRTAEVKTKSSIVIRPVQRLRYLELGPQRLHDPQDMTSVKHQWPMSNVKWHLNQRPEQHSECFHPTSSNV